MSVSLVGTRVGFVAVIVGAICAVGVYYYLFKRHHKAVIQPLPPLKEIIIEDLGGARFNLAEKTIHLPIVDVQTLKKVLDFVKDVFNPERTMTAEYKPGDTTSHVFYYRDANGMGVHQAPPTGETWKEKFEKTKDVGYQAAALAEETYHKLNQNPDNAHFQIKKI
jgi:hypothetical protein